MIDCSLFHGANHCLHSVSNSNSNILLISSHAYTLLDQSMLLYIVYSSGALTHVFRVRQTDTIHGLNAECCKPFILQNWYENHINISSRFERKLNNEILWISFVTLVFNPNTSTALAMCAINLILFSLIQYVWNVKSDILDFMCFVLFLLNSMIAEKQFFVVCNEFDDLVQVVSRKPRVNNYEWDPLCRHMKHETQSFRKQSLIIFMIFIIRCIAFHDTSPLSNNNVLETILSIHLTHIQQARNVRKHQQSPLITNNIMAKIRFYYWFHWLAQLNQQLYSIDLTSGCERIFFQFHI